MKADRGALERTEPQRAGGEGRASSDAEVLDALPLPVARLDWRGRVVHANLAWIEGDGAGLFGPTCQPGVDYVAACERAALPQGKRLAAALRAVLGGERRRCVVENEETEGGLRSSVSSTGEGVVVAHVEQARPAEVDLPASNALEMRDAKSRSDATVRLARLTEQTHRIASTGTWEVDFEDGSLYFSPETYRLLETSPAEYAPAVDTAIARFAPESAAILMKALQLAREKGEPFDRELPATTAKGRSIRVRLVGEVFREAGEITHAIGSLQDVTEQRQAEKELRRMETILKATTDLVGIANVERGLLYINEAGREFLGLGADEDITGRSLEEFHPPWAYRKVSEEGIPAAIRDGAWSGETAMIDAQGRDVPVSQVLIAHKNATGEVEYLSTIVRDLSAQKAMEAQLLHSQKMEAIGRLAGGVAHDFNNLLTVIQGNAEVAQERIGGEQPVAGCVQSIRTAADRAADLTSQLLAFARKQIVEPRVLQLNEVVLEVDRMLRRLLGEDIELVTLPAEDLWPVAIDPGQLQQVLVNLAVNARDAMPRGGKLKVETRNVLLDEAFAQEHPGVEPGEYVRCLFRDTGVGMDEDVRRHVFEPFFTTKQSGQGTGLGLSTCHGIVEQNGGHIWIRSRPGVGTTVEIVLPRSLASAQPAAYSGARERPRGSETLLLVEDEEMVRRIAERTLREAGYTVLSAATASEAERLAEEHGAPIDLLVTDVVLPQTSGRVLAEGMLAERPDLRVLFTSGYTDDTILRHGVLGEQTHFLPKPYTPTRLARHVRAVLDDENGRAGGMPLSP